MSIQLFPVIEVGAKVSLVVVSIKDSEQVQAIGQLEGAVGKHVVIVIIRAHVGNECGQIPVTQWSTHPLYEP